MHQYSMYTKNTSKICPIHDAPIIHEIGFRIRKCSKGNELWCRNIVACYNLLLKTLLDDGSRMPFGLIVTMSAGIIPMGLALF